MTCNRPVFSLVVIAVLADALPSAAHVGDRVYPIVFLSDETLAYLDLEDMNVEAWVDAVGEPTLTPLDFTLMSHPSLISYDQYDPSNLQYDPSNLDFRIWLGWTKDGKIHVAAEFADDVYRNDDPPTFYFSDSIALLVDGDHSGGRYKFIGAHGMNETPELNPHNNRQAQHYEAISRVASGPMVDLPYVSPNVDTFWMLEPPFAFGGGGVVGENPTFWVIKFFATCFDQLDVLNPEDSVVSRFSEGKVIGFDFIVNDWDEDSGRNARFFLSDLDDEDPGGEGADFFVDGLLLGLGGELGDSAVQSISWGRIKASLEVSSPPSGSIPGMN